jgi:hypothetical protein
MQKRIEVLEVEDMLERLETALNVMMVIRIVTT